MSMTRINVHLTTEQKDKIAADARREGISLSAYVTAAALGLAEASDAKAAALQAIKLGLDATSDRLDDFEDRADKRDAAFFERLNAGLSTLLARVEKLAEQRQ